jgi:FAD/FMN-containing dehydrogenase
MIESETGHAGINVLLETLGPRVVTVDGISERYHCDWTGASPCAPAALIRPRSTEEVASALSICDRHGLHVVPQGGMTGLAGGATPTPGAVALSTERLAGIEEVDASSMTMTLLAGTTLEAAQQAAAASGFELTYDLGARGSCSVGGNVATNAGGNRVLRYGMTREHVLGLEVVLADGTVVTALNKLLKNNAGFDTKQVFIGSEGTLGIVTRVVLRLRPALAGRTTALVACPDYPSVLALLAAFSSRTSNLTGFEAMWPDYYHLLARLREVTPPVAIDGGLGVVVEVSSSEPSSDEALVEEAIADAVGAGLVTDGFIARSHSDAEAIWNMRESGPLSALDGLVAFDVGLSPRKIDAYIAEVTACIADAFPDTLCYAFGHLADGNLHLCVVADGDEPTDEAIDKLVYAAVAKYGGTVSAEHGIGLLKRPYLSSTRAEPEVELMRRIKLALDPNGTLNPGKVI